MALAAALLHLHGLPGGGTASRGIRQGHLTHWNLLYQASAKFVGFSTYDMLFQDSIFWSSLWRTCEWTVGTVIIEFAVALPLAMALNHWTRLTGLATGLILLPWIAPTTVVSYAWVWILDSQFGFVTAALRTVHLVGSTSPLASYSSALPAIVVASGWKGAPLWPFSCLRP